MTGRPIIKNQSSGYCSGDGNPACAGYWAGAEILHHKHFCLEECESIDEKAYEWLSEELNGETEIEIEAYFDCGYDETVGLGQYADLDEWFPNEEFEGLVERCPYLDDEKRKVIFDWVEKFAEEEDGYVPYGID